MEHISRLESLQSEALNFFIIWTVCCRDSWSFCALTITAFHAICVGVNVQLKWCVKFRQSHCTAVKSHTGHNCCWPFSQAPPKQSQFFVATDLQKCGSSAHQPGCTLDYGNCSTHWKERWKETVTQSGCIYCKDKSGSPSTPNFWCRTDERL